MGHKIFLTAGAQAIAAALQNNRTLTSLNFSYNQIGTAGAQAIAAALQSNRTLTHLNLSFNQIGVAGAQAIAAALQNNTTLTSLNLDSHHIGYELLDLFKAIIERNQNSQTIANKIRNLRLTTPPIGEEISDLENKFISNHLRPENCAGILINLLNPVAAEDVEGLIKSIKDFPEVRRILITATRALDVIVDSLPEEKAMPLVSILNQINLEDLFKAKGVRKTNFEEIAAPRITALPETVLRNVFDYLDPKDIKKGTEVIASTTDAAVGSSDLPRTSFANAGSASANSDMFFGDRDESIGSNPITISRHSYRQLPTSDTEQTNQRLLTEEAERSGETTNAPRVTFCERLMRCVGINR